jgi:hypothetical protein
MQCDTFAVAAAVLGGFLLHKPKAAGTAATTAHLFVTRFLSFFAAFEDF